MITGKKAWLAGLWRGVDAESGRPARDARLSACAETHRKTSPDLIVAVLIVAASVAGIIGPALKPTLPRDLIEGFLWGRSFQLGYYKHPPLQAWILGAIEHLAPGQWWIAFLLAQFCVGIAIWAVWRLASALLGHMQGAVAAALTLAGISYYGAPTATFTPDTLSLPLWSLMLLYYWRAVGEQRPRYWYALSVSIVLFFYAKYTFVLLVGSLGLLTLCTREGRTALRMPAPWYAALLCLILASPHLFWLWHHPSPLAYPFDRLPADSVTERFWFSGKFVSAQLLNHVPLAVLLFVLLWPGRSRPRLVVTAPPLSRFAIFFVLTVTLLPLLILVALNLWSGVEFRHGWGTPLFAGSAILALIFLGPQLKLRRLRLTATLALALVTIPHLVNGIAPYLSSWPLWGALPARELADRLTAEYRRKVGKPLRIVIGDRHFAGAVAFYSKDRPRLLIDASYAAAPWVTPTMVQTEGALVIWPKGTPPAQYRANLGDIAADNRLSLPWQNRMRSPLLELDWTILPAKAGS